MAIGLNAGSGPASHGPDPTSPGPVTRPLGTFTGALPLTLLIACAPDNPGPGSFADGCTLNTAAVCEDCLELEHQFQIGSVAGPGFISGRGGEDQIVRDGAGNYWISQREHMNVYGPGGEFIRTVGREGEGPMEFQYARPFHADAAGHIHILDHPNLRVSVVTPDFELVDEKPISGQQINDMIAIDDGALYVMQMWNSDPANPGQPIHIVDGRDVVSSFGQEYGRGDDPSDFNPLETRYLAAAPDGAVMVAHREEYVIEAWSRDGRLLGSLTGPDLDNAPFQPGDVTPENPLPNYLSDMLVDASGRVWISMWLRRPDWVENSVEDPQGGLMPIDMNVLNWFRGRIDLVDVETCTLLASHEQDAFFVDFMENGLVADVEFSPVGVPLINIRRIELRGAARVLDGGAQDLGVEDPVEAKHPAEAAELAEGAVETDGPAEDGAPAAEESPAVDETGVADRPPITGWTVGLDVDEGDLRDTVSYAWSPGAEAPEPLGQADGDFRSGILYRCLDAQEREFGNVDVPIRVTFGAPPRLVGGEELEPGGASARLEVSTHWAGETVVMNAYVVPRGWWIYLEQEDAADRESGESSHAEFLRRLLESGSTGPDIVMMELDWEGVGPVSWTYSLEGAANAILEAGRPCGVG